MDRNEFSKLEQVQDKGLTKVRREMKGCYSFISTFVISSEDKSQVSIKLRWAGSEDLLFNSVLSLLKDESRMGQLARNAVEYWKAENDKSSEKKEQQ